MLKRKAQLYEIEQSLPQKNSMYLMVSFKTFQYLKKFQRMFFKFLLL